MIDEHQLDPMVNLRHTESEQALIGALMIDNDAFAKVAHLVKANDFYAKVHRVIFKTAAQLADISQPTDLVTLAERLETNNELDSVGGFAYLGEIAKNTPSSANIVAYARIVKSKAKERFLYHRMSEVAAIMQNHMPTDEKINLAMAKIEELTAVAVDNQHGGLVDFATLSEKWITEIEARNNDPESARGDTTGFEMLDNLLGNKGVVNGLYAFGGRPKMGKTQVSIAWAEHVAIDLNKPVCMFNMEMDDIQTIERVMAQRMRVSTDEFYQRMDDEIWGRLNASYSDHLSANNLYIDTRTSLTVAQIKAEARRLKNELGELGLIVIDYLTLLKFVSKAERRDIVVGEAVKAFKNLGKDLGCPVLLLCQLSREVEKRPNKRPVTSDLRDSGEIEQHADAVIMAYRDEVYNVETQLKGLAELIITANRHGACGTAYVGFKNGNIHPVDVREVERQVSIHNEPSQRPYSGGFV